MTSPLHSRSLRVVVIDDRAEHEQMYRKFFEVMALYQQRDKAFMHGWDVSFRFCSDFTTSMSELKSPGVHLCLRDVMLAPNWATADAVALTEYIAREGMPLILISEFFQNEALPELRSIVRRLGSFPPLMRWSDLEEVVQGKAANEAFAIFEHFVDLLLDAEPLIVEDDEEIACIHITDLHYGDAGYFAGQIESVASAVQHLTQPSFLAITGDVTDKGMPQEFEKARKAIESLVEFGLVGKGTTLPSRRIAITPGNHDFSWGLALAGAIDVENYGASNEKITLSLSGENTRLAELAGFGLRPFNDFAHAVCRGYSYQKKSGGYRYISDFTQAGIHIVELNVEKFRIPGTSQRLVNDEAYTADLKALMLELKDVPAGDCIIFLGHRRDVSDHLWQKNLQSVLRPLANRHAVILLSGHEHGFSQQTQENDRSWLAITGNCLGYHKKTDLGNRPTVLHIAIKRSARRVVAVVVNKLEHLDGKWSAIPQEPFECEYLEGGRPRW